MKDIEKIEEKYKRDIRKYPTYKLLEYFSKKSIEAFKDNQSAFMIYTIPVYNKKGGIKKIDIGYGQWDLIQICYDSIKFSNDYRGKEILDDNDFFYLINSHRSYEEKSENVSGDDKLKIFEHLQCITNIQFDFQSLDICTSFNRMYHILFYINKNKKYDQTDSVSYINFEEKFKEITNMNMQKFIAIYFFIIFVTYIKNLLKCDYIINDEEILEYFNFTKDEIIQFLELQAKDYSFYRATNNWNLLRFYPIVKTSDRMSNYIISNMFAAFLSVPNSIYWILRNYYNSINSRDFTSYFGKCFEYFFEEVLDYYNINYNKLIESTIKGQKMPDWKIETGKYILLIEQKATLFPIETRTITKEERYNSIEKYFNNTFIKAFKQLNAYNPETNKVIVRICLTFEKIYMEENVKDIIKELDQFDFDSELNWIVNIGEMEILMDLLSSNEEKFNKVIEEKIYLEKKNDNNGRTLANLFKKMELNCNYANFEIDYYSKIVEKIRKGNKNL